MFKNKTAISLLLKRPPKDGTIDSLANRWRTLVKAPSPGNICFCLWEWFVKRILSLSSPGSFFSGNNNLIINELESNQKISCMNDLSGRDSVGWLSQWIYIVKKRKNDSSALDLKTPKGHIHNTFNSPSTQCLLIFAYVCKNSWRHMVFPAQNWASILRNMKIWHTRLSIINLGFNKWWWKI